MRFLVGVLLAGITLAGCTALSPAATYTQPQLKYLLLDHYGEDRFFYCDPDFYPVSFGDEQEKAVEAFPAVMNDTEEFAAITNRTGYGPPYSDAAKLAIYREHKRLRAIPLEKQDGNYYTYAMAIGTGGQGRRVSGVIRRDGKIVEQTTHPAVLSCPICLPTGTRIATPDGSVPIEEVRAGTVVWTVDADGERVAAPVLEATGMEAPPYHRVVRVRLSDGRTVTASPGHPTGDGRRFGSLGAGDILDGSTIASVDTVPYGGGRTYDLLPAGPTGRYWADGVLLGSTLC